MTSAGQPIAESGRIVTVTTTDLAAWLLEQIAEDERRAQAANVKQDDPHWFLNPVRASVPRRFTVRSAEDSRPIARIEDLAGDEEADTVGILDGEAVGEYIVSWDPARVLAECDAKRRIVELHKSAGRLCTGDPDLPESWHDYCDTCGSGEPYEYPTPWPCDTLKLLALPYADRPGYREDWRP